MYRRATLLGSMAVTLMFITASAEDCSSAVDQAQGCLDTLFTPQPCGHVMSQAPPHLRAYLTSVMAGLAYDAADGMTWEDAVRERLGKWMADFQFIINTGNGLDTQVVVAVSHEGGELPSSVFVFFRGSAEDVDWETNLRTDFTDVPGLGRIHSGFYGAYSIVSSQLSGYISAFRNASREVIFAGHSLGGALATIAAVHQELLEAYSVGGVFTFGSPRVGDTSWAAAYQNAGLSYTTYRYVAGLDPVPLLPPSYYGYQHVGIEVSMLDNSCMEKQHANYCSSNAVPNTPGNFDGLPAWVAEQACGGSGFLADLAGDFGAWWKGWDLEYSVTDLVSSEPELCCSNVGDHYINRYTALIRDICMDPCDWMVQCICEAPSPDFTIEEDSTPATATYKFIVKTSCEGSSGTDGNVRIEIGDASGRWFRTGYLDNSEDNYEQCNADFFETSTVWYVDMGSVQEASVYFEPSGLFAGWLPDFIQVIQNPYTNRETGVQFCNGNGWLETTGWYSFYRC